MNPPYIAQLGMYGEFLRSDRNLHGQIMSFSQFNTASMEFIEGLRFVKYHGKDRALTCGGS